jgi:hypothetical protein
MRNRVIVFAIAFSQFWLPLALMGVALYGGSLLLMFGLWGFVNAFVLLSYSVLARKSALIWHIIIVGYVLITAINRPPNNQGDRIIVLWAAGDLAAVFYLAQTVLHPMQDRTKSGT